jgi:hypothetical protein
MRKENRSSDYLLRSNLTFPEFRTGTRGVRSGWPQNRVRERGGGQINTMNREAFSVLNGFQFASSSSSDVGGVVIIWKCGNWRVLSRGFASRSVF